MAKDTEKTASAEPNSNLYFGTGQFELPNGDRYEGDYCAHRYGLIWREGRGTYITKDGQTYEGEWKDDKLIEATPLVIKFPTGEEYHGPLSQEQYSGAGTYTLDNKMNVTCEFFDSKPKGTVVLIDVKGNVWEGHAGADKVLLLPENTFYLTISEDRGKGEPKLPKEATEARHSTTSHESQNEDQQPELSDRDMEKIVFGKSSKTASELDFTDSKWYQRYLRFITMRKTISKKLKLEEDLTHEEKRWKIKYEKYKERRRVKEKEKDAAQKKKPVVDTSLLETFYSKKFKESCPPIKVFHPTCDWEQDYYLTAESELKKEDTEAT